MNTEQAIVDIQAKIKREEALLNAANAMRQSTNNPAVLSRLDGQIREGRRNIDYLQGKLRDVELRRLGSDVDGMTLRPGSASHPRDAKNPLTPPPKDGWNSYVDSGGYGDTQQGYGQLSAGHGGRPRAPFPSNAPGAPPKRPNYSRLGSFLAHARVLASP